MKWRRKRNAVGSAVQQMRKFHKETGRTSASSTYISERVIRHLHRAGGGAHKSPQGVSLGYTRWCSPPQTQDSPLRSARGVIVTAISIAPQPPQEYRCCRRPPPPSPPQHLRSSSRTVSRDVKVRLVTSVGGGTATSRRHRRARLAVMVVAVVVWWRAVTQSQQRPS